MRCQVLKYEEKVLFLFFFQPQPQLQRRRLDYTSSRYKKLNYFKSLLAVFSVRRTMKAFLFSSRFPLHSQTADCSFFALLSLRNLTELKCVLTRSYSYFSFVVKAHIIVRLSPKAWTENWRWKPYKIQRTVSRAHKLLLWFFFGNIA
jgi:hypothetical protein